MTDDTEIGWHKEQIAKNRVVLEELEAGNTAGGDVFPQAQSEIEHLKALHANRYPPWPPIGISTVGLINQHVS
jgi:hypothetical protein